MQTEEYYHENKKKERKAERRKKHFCSKGLNEILDTKQVVRKKKKTKYNRKKNDNRIKARSIRLFSFYSTIAFIWATWI